MHVQAVNETLNYLWLNSSKSAQLMNTSITSPVISSNSGNMNRFLCSELFYTHTFMLLESSMDAFKRASRIFYQSSKSQPPKKSLRTLPPPFLAVINLFRVRQDICLAKNFCLSQCLFVCLYLDTLIKSKKRNKII